MRDSAVLLLLLPRFLRGDEHDDHEATNKHKTHTHANTESQEGPRGCVANYLRSNPMHHTHTHDTHGVGGDELGLARGPRFLASGGDGRNWARTGVVAGTASDRDGAEKSRTISCDPNTTRTRDGAAREHTHNRTGTITRTDASCACVCVRVCLQFTPTTDLCTHTHTCTFTTRTRRHFDARLELRLIDLATLLW